MPFCIRSEEKQQKKKNQKTERKKKEMHIRIQTHSTHTKNDLDQE